MSSQSSTTSDLFDKSGDALMEQLNQTSFEQTVNTTTYQFPDIIYHTRFIGTRLSITSLSTSDTPISFTAIPKDITTDFRNRKAIIFSHIYRPDNDSMIETLAIPIKDIINIQPTNEDFHLFIKTPEPTSQPLQSQPSTSQHQHSSSTLSDIIPNRRPTTPVPSILQDSFFVISPHQTSTMEEKQQRHLPLLENGKVDLFLIHHWYQQEQPEKKTTFADWRLQQGFTAQMETDKIQMSPPLTYYRGQDPQEITKARKLHDQWASSYLQHQLAFDDWHLLYPTTAMPTDCTHHTPDPQNKACKHCICTNESQCTCCTCITLEQQKILSQIQHHTDANPDTHENTPSQSETISPILQTDLSIHQTGKVTSQIPYADESTDDKQYLPYQLIQTLWMQKTEDEIAESYLKNSSNDASAKNIVQQWREQGGWKKQRITFPVFAHGIDSNLRCFKIFEEPHSFTQPDKNYNAFSPFEISLSLDANGQNVSNYFKRIHILPEDFLPNGRFAAIYIPTYTYIPDICIRKLRIHPRLVPYCRMLLWHKLYHARQQAQLLVTAEHLADIENTLWTNHLMEKIMEDDSISQTFLIDIIQHHEALKMNRDYDLEPMDVYDTLFRPMERLCGLEMPLHDSLLRSRFWMTTRHTLFQNLIKFAGIDIPIKLDHHECFRNLSFIRHLSYDNLTPNHRFGVGPINSITPLDPYEEDPTESPLTIAQLTKVESRIRRQLQEESHVGDPYISLPLHDGYAQEFPEIGGRYMSIKRMKAIIEIHNDIIKERRKHSEVPKISNSPLEDEDISKANQQTIKPQIAKTPPISPPPREEEDTASYSNTLKLRPQRTLQPPIPLKRPQVTSDLEEFPFLTRW